MKYRVPYTAVWHGVAEVDADSAKEAVEYVKAMDEYETGRFTAFEAFPVGPDVMRKEQA